MDRRAHDIDISKRIIGGDVTALADAYDCHAGACYGVALRILRETQAAEDVVQEVFLNLWERPTGYEPAQGALRPWLCAIARHRAIDRVRQAARQARALVILAGAPPQVCDAAEPVLHDAVTTAVRAAVQALPDTHRAAIVLAYYHGLSYRQVATVLGVPEGTARSRLRLGLRRLGRWLTAEGIVD